jgi:DMSO/TMAO reductase YedYZ molybdopterin-dependent catalytic subunit
MARLSRRDLVKVTGAVGLECVGNTVGGEFIGTAEWRGLLLRGLLEEVKVSSSAYDVVFRAADGYSDGIRVERAMAGDVLIAQGMNGVPLPQAHGFPARMIVPGLYGMKSVQWLTEIEVVGQDFKGYYQRKGWTDEATVRTTARIDVPSHGSTVTGPQCVVQGLAFAGTRRIRQVEISVDEGTTWQNAALEPPLSGSSWVFWRYVWRPMNPGRHTLIVRATDGTGLVQISDKQDPAPDGASGLHEVTFTVER